MQKIFYIVSLTFFIMQAGCGVYKPLTNYGSGGNSNKNLTESRMIDALTEALKIAANTSAGNASKVNGYFKNPLIFIPLPPEAEEAKKYLTKIGMSGLVDDAILNINRAAENAAKKAAPIFVDAIINMTINDALGILQGEKNAATQFLKRSTTKQLTNAFSPIIDKALSSTSATKYWTSITSTYNKLPFKEDVNTDLGAYVTEKALEGLFELMEKEEAKIRKNPADWGSNIIEEVFSEFKS